MRTGRKISTSLLSVLGAVVFVSVIVAAAVILTSNTVNTNQTVKDPNNAITLTSVSTSGDIWAGQTAIYAISGSVPQALSNVVVTVTVIRTDGPNIQPSDLNWPNVYITPDNLNYWWASTASCSGGIYTITVPISGSVSGVSWAMGIEFDTPAHYNVAVSMTGQV